MNFDILRENELESVLDLFCECFSKDSYYKKLFSPLEDFTKAMRDSFQKSILYCLERGFCIGIKDDCKLIAFLICFDYAEAKNNKLFFDDVFAMNLNNNEHVYDDFHYKIDKLEGKTIYILSIAVSYQYRRCGIASGLLDWIIVRYAHCNIVSDISNNESLPMYKKRAFDIQAIGTNYHLVVREKGTVQNSDLFFKKIKLLVPNCEDLSRCGCKFVFLKKRYYILQYEILHSNGISCFVRNEFGVSYGVMVEIDYHSLLKYQRLLNLSQVVEHFTGEYLCYEHLIMYDEAPLMNKTLHDMLTFREVEWSLIPDVYISIPVQYKQKEKIVGIAPFPGEHAPKMLLNNLKFRTRYEAGIPSIDETVDDLSCFKKRISRFYLGKIRVVISTESTQYEDPKSGNPIGSNALLDMYISIDSSSECAVLTLYSLSMPFLVSHFFDNVIRSQLLVIDSNNRTNFYDYIKNRFEIIRRGTPKIFALFPCNKNGLATNQLASLLAGETIYPDGEDFGKITDDEIISIVNNEAGMGQYDRALVYAYRNTVLQFSSATNGSFIKERLYEESINLFYIELILFQEAAINIANREIITLFTSPTAEKPVEFLSIVDRILTNYSKTIDFWDIRVNYPTSQKSIEMLRTAFRIDEQLGDMKKNQEQLQLVFDTKCDIVDRKDAKRMDSSLAIISFLAVFSAWMDAYDYIATWNSFFSNKTIAIMQGLTFIIILLAAGYAVTHLFSNKFWILFRKRRDRLKKKRKH